MTFPRRHVCLVALSVSCFIGLGSTRASAQGPSAASDLTLSAALNSPAVAPLNVKYLPADRPAALLPLYVSLISLQAADTAMTIRGLRNGAVEANPAVIGVTQSPVAFMALKGGVTALSIFAAEGFRKRHPVGAVVLLAAINSASAAVVAHNYQVTHR